MKKVLIVIDMQKDFVDGSLSNPDAQAIVTAIASYVKAYDGDVIATRDTHQANYMQTAEGKKLPVPHCIENTDGWQIVDEIDAVLQEKGARILDKPSFGFLGWGMLGEYDEAELVGTCTDICVVSNALIIKAMFPELTVKVNAPLCAGTSQANHNAALAVMGCCQVEIVNEQKHY